jgi:D-sedoheptulose 7-phosphate isomerase
VIEKIHTHLQNLLDIKQALLAEQSTLARIARLAEMCLASLCCGGKVIFAGNGGSFADAQHLSAEFVSRFRFDRPPLASLALGTNNLAISAIANDYGYEHVFSRELAAVARLGDTFIPLSTSGNRENILNAVIASRRLGIATIALTGTAGGKLYPECECIRVPSDDTARIQEVHITVGHVVCTLVKEAYFNSAREIPLMSLLYK